MELDCSQLHNNVCTLLCYMDSNLMNIKLEFEKIAIYFKDYLHTVDAQIDFIIDELELRVESIKIELDNFLLNFKNELNKSRTNIQSKIQIEVIESDLKQLDNDLKNNIEENALQFSIYQQRLDYLKVLRDDVKCIRHPVSLTISDDHLDESIIGQIRYNYKNRENILEINKNLKARLTNPQQIGFKPLQDGVIPADLYSIENKEILIVNYESNLLIYDKNFVLIKKFSYQNHQNIKPLSITSNNKSSIYICTYDNKIYQFDFDLNLVKEIGKFGSGKDEFNLPSCLTYSNDAVFICDNENCRVQKYDASLNFIETFKLNYKPFQIRVNEKLAFVRHNDKMEINFYDVLTFSLKHTFDGHNGSIYELYSHFYEFSSDCKRLYCYDTNGFLLDEIQIDSVVAINKDVKFTGFECLVYFNNRFYISNGISESLVII